MTLVPKSSAVLCRYSCAHHSNIYIPLPRFSCRFCLGFLPELYVESLFVFHIGLIQWSVCMFVRSVMRMHDSNLTLCGRLCHTKSIFKYNQKENNVYGLSSHFENYSSHSEPLNSAHVGRDNDHWNTHPLFFLPEFINA